MKRGNKRVKRYRKNSVHPEKNTKHEKEEKKYEKVNAKFMDKFVREAMSCGCCKQIFNIDSNELKVHCNICNKFFHCGIAVECIGNDCKVIDSLGNIHRARYCVDCVSKLYSNGRCLCKDCSKEYN